MSAVLQLHFALYLSFLCPRQHDDAPSASGFLHVDDYKYKMTIESPECNSLVIYTVSQQQTSPLHYLICAGGTSKWGFKQ